MTKQKIDARCVENVYEREGDMLYMSVQCNSALQITVWRTIDPAERFDIDSEARAAIAKSLKDYTDQEEARLEKKRLKEERQSMTERLGLTLIAIEHLGLLFTDHLRRIDDANTLIAELSERMASAEALLAKAAYFDKLPPANATKSPRAKAA